jgi:single-strand DNA-binding protein
MTPITITGRLVKTSALGFTPSGKAKCNFSLATSRRVKEGDTWKDVDTTFWEVTAWQKLAEHLTDSELPNGTEITVIGEAAERTWTDKTGQERKTLQITARHIGVSISRSPVTLKRDTTKTTTPTAATNTASAWDEDPWTTN